jgi:hypothetical protein
VDGQRPERHQHRAGRCGDIDCGAPLQRSKILACGGLGGSDPGLGCRDGSTHPNGNNAGPVNWGWSPGSDSDPYDWVGKNGTTLSYGSNNTYTINGVTVDGGPRDARAFAAAVDAATRDWAKSKNHGSFDPYDMSLSDVLNMMEHACVPETGTSMCSSAFTNTLKESIQDLNAERIQSHWKTGDKIVYYIAGAVSIAAAEEMGRAGGGRGGRSRGGRGGRGGARDPLGGCHSFTGDTRVELADGNSKPISKIKIGDEILNTEPQHGKDKGHRVAGVIKTSTDRDLVDLSVATATGTGVVTTTRHHRIWDATSHRWTEAGNLQVGHRVQGIGGRTYPIATVRLYSAARITYDLTVSHIHTYYVLAGSAPVLVHNSGGCVPMSSRIGEDPSLVKAAQQAGRSQKVQADLDNLFEQLSRGNMNPGLGTKALAGTDVSYARGRNGGRLFFRNVNGEIQVVGKSDKANESKVIARLNQLYGQ